MASSIAEFAELARAEQGLTIVSTLRADSTVQASLVNAGVIDHPLTGGQVAAFVTYGKVKLANLRVRPQVALSVRSGWRWVTLEGHAQIIGPDDPSSNVDNERLRVMLRGIFSAAGGTHDDWDIYDTVMREQRRAAVFVVPTRVYNH